MALAAYPILAAAAIVTVFDLPIETIGSTTVTDANGQYRITNLPVGTYSVSFSLAGFTRVQRDSIVLTTGFTAAGPMFFTS